MITKRFMLFCCFVVFSVTTTFAHAGRLIFVEPSVANEVLHKYFGSMISSGRWAGMSCAYATDSHILLNALEKWTGCIRGNEDNRVSSDCIANMCRDVFGPVTRCATHYTAADYIRYCKDFAYDLTFGRPTMQDTGCLYTVTKENGSQKNIKYMTANNTGFYRKEGTIAWRFLNPGNLRRSSLQCAQINTRPNGTFAVFDSYQTGRQALRVLLRGNTYSNLTIAKAINKYAPPSDGNNTNSYINGVKRSLSHLPNVNTVLLKDLSDEDLGVLMDTIEVIEGWHNEGRILPIS